MWFELPRALYILLAAGFGALVCFPIMLLWVWTLQKRLYISQKRNAALGDALIQVVDQHSRERVRTTETHAMQLDSSTRSVLQSVENIIKGS